MKQTLTFLVLLVAVFASGVQVGKDKGIVLGINQERMSPEYKRAQAEWMKKIIEKSDQNFRRDMQQAKKGKG